MLKEYKYHICPDKKQIGACLFIYNLALQIKIHAWKSTHMKKTFFLLVLLIPVICFSRQYQYIGTPDNIVKARGGLMSDTAFYLPIFPSLSDTAGLTSYDRLGDMIFIRNVSTIYFRDTIIGVGHKWTALSVGANFANTNLTLTANRTHQLNDFSLRIDKGTDPTLRIDPSNGAYQLGKATFNGSYLSMDTTSGITLLQAANAHYLEMNAPSNRTHLVMQSGFNFLDLDAGNGTYQMGDISPFGLGNNTYMKIDDANSQYTFNTGGARKALLDGNGQWTWDGYPGLTHQTDTITYKPIAYDGSGNIVPMANWSGGSGSSPGLQNVITTDSILVGAYNPAYAAYVNDIRMESDTRLFFTQKQNSTDSVRMGIGSGRWYAISNASTGRSAYTINQNYLDFYAMDQDGNGAEFDIMNDPTNNPGAIYYQYGTAKKGIQYADIDSSQWTDSTLITKKYLNDRINGLGSPSLQNVITTDPILTVDNTIYNNGEFLIRTVLSSTDSTMFFQDGGTTGFEYKSGSRNRVSDISVNQRGTDIYCAALGTYSGGDLYLDTSGLWYSDNITPRVGIRYDNTDTSGWTDSTLITKKYLNDRISGFTQLGAANYSKVTDITSDITATNQQYFFTVDATSGNVTITLPAASTVFSGSVGIKYIFHRIDNTVNTVTISRTGSDTINGSTSFTLTGQYQTKEVQCISTSTWAQYNN